MIDYETIYNDASQKAYDHGEWGDLPEVAKSAGIAAVVAAAKLDALTGELTEFRKRVEQGFEWPNPEEAMYVLGEIQFLMISERFPITTNAKATQ